VVWLINVRRSIASDKWLEKRGTEETIYKDCDPDKDKRNRGNTIVWPPSWTSRETLSLPSQESIHGECDAKKNTDDVESEM
jgi:hypothetical protein